MHLPRAGWADAPKSLDFSLAQTNVRVEGPQSVLAVLEATLSYVPRFASGECVDVTVSVESKANAWEIHARNNSLKVLAAKSALPDVAGAVVSTVINDVAATRNCKALRACVVEKDGRALAFIGDDWESSITLAAHLHGRGWAYVGSDNALLDSETLEVFPVQKALYINSSSVSQFPIEYRRAVEASPWYVTSQGISFYAVDPSYAGRLPWASATPLHAVVIVDGAIADRASLESLEADRFKSDRFRRLSIDWTRVATVDLRLGSFVDSADLVEHWFDSICT